MVNYRDARGGDPCTVAGVRAIDEPDEGHGELEITVDCGTTNPRKDRPGEHPGSGSSVIGCVSSGDRARWGPAQTDGSGSSDREVSLRISSGLSGKQRRTLTPNIRLCWLDGESLPCARRGLNAKGRPTRPGVPRLAEDQARTGTVLVETEW